MALAQPAQTDDIVPKVDINDDYPQRADRLYDVPCAQNAQGLFSPEACLFIGNLSIRVPPEKLSVDLEALFSRFGKCHVKIKCDGIRRLPTAFCQYEKVEDAKAVLNRDSNIHLHNRKLRVEKAKGRRTCVLGLRSGAAMTHELFLDAINKRGPIEAYTFQQSPVYVWNPDLAMQICIATQVCIATFAYVQDCHEAIQHFENHATFYLHLEPVTGSPLLSQVSNSPNQNGRAGVKVNWRWSQSSDDTTASPSASPDQTSSNPATTSTNAETVSPNRDTTSAKPEDNSTNTDTFPNIETWDSPQWRYPNAPLTAEQRRKIRPRSSSTPVKASEQDMNEDDETRMSRVCPRRKRSYSCSF